MRLIRKILRTLLKAIGISFALILVLILGMVGLYYHWTDQSDHLLHITKDDRETKGMYFVKKGRMSFRIKLKGEAYQNCQLIINSTCGPESPDGRQGIQKI